MSDKPDKEHPLEHLDYDVICYLSICLLSISDMDKESNSKESMDNIETVVDAEVEAGSNYEACDDEDVVDFTKSLRENEEFLRSVRISNGIRLSELNNEGIVFTPEIEEINNENNSYARSYFANHSEELEKLLSNSLIIGDNDSESVNYEDFLNDFDSLKMLMTDITGNGGVMKRVTKVGLQTAGDVPANGVIKIHYSMHLEGQDEPYDSSILRGRPEKYKIGEGQLITGLELGILTMKKDEKAQFLIDPKYAFGSLGCPPRIPAEAQILANVELLDFVENGKAEAILSLTSDERNQKFSFDDIEKAASIEHKCGNNAVRSVEWKYAVKHYERGIKLLQETSLANYNQEQRSQKILLKLLLNAAHCYLKLQMPKKACIVCKEALEIENNTKALFR